VQWDGGARADQSAQLDGVLRSHRVTRAGSTSKRAETQSSASSRSRRRTSAGASAGCRSEPQSSLQLSAS